MVTDRWSAQMKTNTADKELCLAHLQRDVQYLVETEKHLFSIQFKDWLAEVWEAKRQSTAKQGVWKKEDKVTKELE